MTHAHGHIALDGDGRPSHLSKLGIAVLASVAGFGFACPPTLSMYNFVKQFDDDGVWVPISSGLLTGWLAVAIEARVFYSYIERALYRSDHEQTRAWGVWFLASIMALGTLAFTMMEFQEAYANNNMTEEEQRWANIATCAVTVIPAILFRKAQIQDMHQYYRDAAGDVTKTAMLKNAWVLFFTLWGFRTTIQESGQELFMTVLSYIYALSQATLFFSAATFVKSETNNLLESLLTPVGILTVLHLLSSTVPALVGYFDNIRQEGQVGNMVQLLLSLASSITTMLAMMYGEGKVDMNELAEGDTGLRSALTMFLFPCTAEHDHESHQAQVLDQKVSTGMGV